MDALYDRRSIRVYSPEAVSDEAIDGVLRAAMYAPSAGNEQPWHFVVVRDRDTLNGIAKIHPHAQMVLQAPVAIVVCGDMDLASHGEMWVQDCAAATENLLLAVHEQGLGAVWCALHPVAERQAAFRKLLGIPENVRPFALIPLGHPGEKKDRPERFDSSRIHRDRW